MTREEAIQFLDNMKHEEAGRAIGNDGFYAELMGHHVEALNIAIKALEHPEQNVIAVVPCGDAISRQAAIKAIYDNTDRLEIAQAVRGLPSITPKQTEITLESAIDYLHSIGWMQKHDKELTEGVEQEPKTGRWINRHIIANKSIDMIVCSECGEEFSYDAETGISDYDYCPNCGAKMIEPQESEGKE